MSRTLPTPLAVVGILATGAVVLVPSLFTRDPWNPDEPRATEVAREMVALGNYLVPHLNGEPYSDKPPVFYWLAAGFWRAGAGLNSGRLVSLLAATGTALLVYALGRRLHSAELGLYAAIVTLTTKLFWFIGKFGVLDPLLTLFTTLSIYCIVRALDNGAATPSPHSPLRTPHSAFRIPHSHWWLGAYAAAALAVLTKGPVGLMVPLLVGLAYGILRRGKARAGGWWHLAGAALFLGLVAAWLVPACIHGGEAYTRDILFQQTAQRMGENASHYQPFYFYLLHAPLMFLPWTLLLALALAWALRAARGLGDRAGLLAAAWLIVVFVFFSLFSGKRERYLLPLVPAAGLLCARYAIAVVKGELAPLRWHHGLWKATLVILGLAGVLLVGLALSSDAAVGRFTHEPAVEAEVRAALGPLVLVVAGLAGAAVLAACLWGIAAPWGAGGEPRRLAAAAAAVVILSLAVDLAATPIINRFKSGRDLIERAGPYVRDADEVLLYQSDYSGVYNLFTRRVRMPVVEDEKGLLARLTPGRRVALIARESATEGLLNRVPLHEVARERVGHRKLVVLANWKDR